MPRAFLRLENVMTDPSQDFCAQCFEEFDEDGSIFRVRTAHGSCLMCEDCFESFYVTDMGDLNPGADA
jgi:predicted metal-binding protein